YSLATGQPLGPARQGDAPAYFTPTSSDTLQTGTGLLAVGSKYGLTLMDENGRAVVAPDNLPPPGSYQNPNSFNGHAIVEIGDELMVLTTQTTRGGMFFQATSRIVGQKYLADGTTQGAEFEVIAGVTHPTNTPEENFVQAAALTDGRVAVLVPNANATAVPDARDPAYLSLTVLNADGSVSIPWFDIPEVTSHQSGSAHPRVSLNALDNGGFVVGYNITGSSVFEGMAFQVFDAEASPVHDATFIQTAGGPVATGQEFTILDTAGNGIVTGGELIALTMSVTPPDSVDDPG
ncbi:hypothetical protein AB9K41_00325, partial [Cribrihabitans sp. XS_ASV171]